MRAPACRPSSLGGSSWLPPVTSALFYAPHRRVVQPNRSPGNFGLTRTGISRSRDIEVRSVCLLRGFLARRLDLGLGFLQQGYEQAVELADEGARVVDAGTQGKDGLVVENVRPFGKACLVWLVRQTCYERVLRVDLQHWLNRESGFLQLTGKKDVRFRFVTHDTGGRAGETGGNPDVPDPVPQSLLETADQAGELSAGPLAGVLFLLVFQRTEVCSAVGNRLKPPSFELPKAADDPVVDPIVEEQNFNAFFPERLQVRAAFGSGQGGCHHVVDLFLAFLHTAYVVAERDVRLAVRGNGRCKPQQPGDIVPVGIVIRDTLLQDGTEFIPERGVLLGLVLGEVAEEFQYLFGRVRSYDLDRPAALQQLPRYVQRQVAGVDHAADEPQVIGHELPAVLHDEHPLDVQPDATRGHQPPQVQRRARRDEQQQRVFVVALDLGVQIGDRVAVVVGDVPVELGIVLVGELALGPCPECR